MNRLAKSGRPTPSTAPLGRFVLAAAAAAAGCRAPPAATSASVAAPQTSERSVRVFSEPVPVTAVAVQGPYVWAGGERGLVRWRVKSEEMTPVSVREIAGRAITALAPDTLGGLWVATDAGLGRLNGDQYEAMPPHAAPVTVLAPLRGATSAWVGGPTGLFKLDGSAWTAAEPLRGVPVVSLELDPSGDKVWVGTRGRGLVRIDAKGTRFFGPTEDIDLVDVVGTAARATGSQLAAGRGEGGAARLLLIDGESAHLLRAEPETPVLHLVAVAGSPVLVSGPPHAPRLFTLKAIKRGEPAPAGGFRFLPLRSSAEASRFAAEPMPLAAPQAPTVAAAGPDGLWLGTRSLGVARPASGTPLYLRAQELVEGARRVSVACEPGDRPRRYLATGGARAWSFDGRTFAPESMGAPAGGHVGAILEDGKSIYAVSAEPEAAAFVVTRLVRDRHWEVVRRLIIQAPEGSIVLPSFAALSPSGVLWVGVLARDAERRVRAFGVLEHDLERNQTLHHRRYAHGERAPPGVLPLDKVVTAAVFDGPAAWFSSAGGVMQFHESQLRSWTENEGLESETCNDIALGPNRQVWVATPDGVGRYDGRAWEFPDESTRVRAAALASDAQGRMWVASSRGLVVVGPSGGFGDFTLGLRDGLMEEDVVDVAIDRLGRVWALGPTTIAVIE